MQSAIKCKMQIKIQKSPERECARTKYFSIMYISRMFSLSFYAEIQRREPPEVQTADSGTRVEIEPAKLEYTLAKKFNSALYLI